MTDIVLESVRAIVLFGLVLFLVDIGRTRFSTVSRGWNWVVAGFCLLFFGSLLDISDNFETLNRFVVIGDTESEVFLEKFVGFLGGFVVLAVGLVRWIPEELTERRRAEELLTEAIEGMPEGFTYYDADDRLAMFNKKMAQTYPLIADVFQPGTTFEEVLRTGIERGQFVEAQNREEEFFKEKLACHRDPRGAVEYILPDGRWIWVEEKKTPKGGIVGVRADITELKRAEEALRESEERFRAIFSHVIDAIITIDSHGIVEGFYPAAERIFGYDAAEVVGKNISMLMPEPDRSEHDGYLKRYLETGKGPVVCLGREVEGKRKDGSVFPADLGVTRMEVGGRITFIGTLRDITERKRVEEAFRASEERFRDVAEAALDWFWEMDETLRFTFFYGRGQQLIGLSPEEFIGRTRWEVAEANPDENEKWRHHRATLEAHEAFRDLEYAFTTKDGKTVHNKVSGKPVFDANGVFKGYRGAATDVTEQREIQAQLIQASKLAILGEMASGIAHEINQPLSVIGMSAELSPMSMEEGEFDTEFVRKKLETIVGQRDRMVEIVNHMRLFSRKDEADLESFDPVNSVAGAVGLIAKQLKASGIELEEDLPTTCRNVLGHPSRLEQVVLNLLTNARDAVLATSAASGNGSPAPKVRVSLVDDKRRKTVVISVADNGGGIPEAALERIFDPFFTTKTEGHGTGLGLSISYSIINAMAGRLEARNVEDGARFEITLPVAGDGRGAKNGRAKEKKPKARTEIPAPGLPRVLVVDDEEAIVEEVAEYLGRKGYDVATAGNGREALDLHKARPADVVVTDLFMPGMRGAELIRRLHKSDPDLPIVVVTGHTTFGDDREIVVDGASAVLKKLIVLRELTESLKERGGGDPADLNGLHASGPRPTMRARARPCAPAPARDTRLDKRCPSVCFDLAA